MPPAQPDAISSGSAKTTGTVRRLRESDLEAYRALRLDALRADPLAFGSTLERERAYPEERWKEWTRRGAAGERDATFVAEASDGRLLGMAVLAHVEGAFHVFGMWVRPDARGRGLGGRLLDASLGWLEARFPEAPVLLSVNPEQGAAVALYRSRGFEFTGREEPLGHHAPAVTREMRRAATRRSDSE
jgi:ribosomal protein S18 acetylase RimI-like enzyme